MSQHDPIGSNLPFIRPCPQCSKTISRKLGICPHCAFALPSESTKASLSRSTFVKAVIGICIESTDLLANEVTTYLCKATPTTPQRQFAVKLELLVNNLATANVLFPTSFPQYAEIRKLIREYDKAVKRFLKATIAERRLRRLLITRFAQRSETLWEAATDGNLQHVLPMSLQAILQETIGENASTQRRKTAPSIESDIFYGTLVLSVIELLDHYFKLTDLQ